MAPLTCLLFTFVFVGQNVFSHPLTENPITPTKYSVNPSLTLINRRQEVVAVPPVATSILEGPYLPPTNADTQLFVGDHGVPTPIHHGYPLFPGGHVFHRFPYFPHPGYHNYYMHPQYYPMIPWGLRHGFHTHWPHMLASGPVFLADPNDGMYQEPVTGTPIPRPVIPPQYSGFMSHVGGMHDYHLPGSMFFRGQGRSVFPIDTATVEDQIVDNEANLHSSPNADVTEKLAEMRQEEELERMKLIKAMKTMKSKSMFKKPPKQRIEEQ